MSDNFDPRRGQTPPTIGPDGPPAETATAGELSFSGPDARPALALRSAEFRKGREEGWRRLDNMVGRIEKNGISNLRAEEVQELPLLYRATMSSLSVARSIVLDRNLLIYLENLSLRAYLAVYGPRVGLLESLKSFLCRGFPQYVREMKWHLAIIFAIFLAGVIAGYVLVGSDLSNFYTLVPEELSQGRGPETTAEELRKTELFAPWPGFVDTFIVFANSLFRHNSVIGIMAFGLGFALGLPTIMLITYNGLTIGAFIRLHAEKGLMFEFLGWLSIHGVTEILAIMLCGAAGLVLAEKIIFPGELPRLEGLARHGRRAASVVAGAVGLFFIAGFLEGGFRQLITDTYVRYIFALMTGVLWLLYFNKVGRAEDEAGSRSGPLPNEQPQPAPSAAYRPRRDREVGHDPEH